MSVILIIAAFLSTGFISQNSFGSDNNTHSIPNMYYKGSESCTARTVYNNEQIYNKNSTIYVEQIIEALKTSMSKVFSVKGDFSQGIVCNDYNVNTEMKGVFEIKRPNKYQLKYSYPAKYYFISDGNNSFFYDKSYNRVYVIPTENSFLADASSIIYGVITDKFEIAYMGYQNIGEESLKVIRVIPKDTYPLIKEFLLTVSDKPPFIRRITVVDLSGCIIKTTFKNVRFNTGAKDSRFKFSPPKNAQIITP